MNLERANFNDSEVLTRITKKSKGYWGYSDEQMEIWSASLTISKAYIETKSVFKLLVENEIIGYYSYFGEGNKTVKLDNLFVLPEYIGKGYGQALMLDFLDRMQESGIDTVTLESDPHAEGFYLKYGFTKMGFMETSISDRYLSVMEMKIKP